jgi:hypothetical protein
MKMDWVYHWFEASIGIYQVYTRCVPDIFLSYDIHVKMMECKNDDDVYPLAQYFVDSIWPYPKPPYWISRRTITRTHKT